MKFSNSLTILAVYLSVMLSIPSPITMSSLWPTFLVVHEKHPWVHILTNLLPAATSLSVCLSALVNGVVVRKKGWRLCLLVGLFFHAFLGILSKFVFFSPFLYFLFRFLIGYFISLVIISTSVALTGFEKDFPLRFVFAFQNVAFGLGGSLLSSCAYVLAKFNWSFVHYVQGLTLIPMFILLGTRNERLKIEENLTIAAKSSYVPQFLFLFLFLSSFCLMEVSASQYTFIPYYLFEMFSFSPSEIARHHRFYFLAEVSGSFAFGFLFRFFQKRLGFFGVLALFLTTTFLVFPIQSYQPLKLFAILSGLSAGLLIPFFHVFVARESHKKYREQNFGYLSASFSLGEFVLPIIGVLGVTSFHAKAWVTCGFAFLAMLSLTFVFFKMRSPSTS
jgi:MFS family permease